MSETLSQPARRAREAYASDRWTALTESHALLMRAHVPAAMIGFRDVLRGLTDLMGDSPYAWPQFSVETWPSASSALIYLSDFFHLVKVWQPYPALAAPIRAAPVYTSLPPHMRARIETAWFASQASMLPYETLTDGYDAALALVHDDDSPDGRRARTAVHLFAADANSRRVRNAVALAHAKSAVALSKTLPEPYFAIRAYEELANVYYNAGTINDDPELYAACAEAQDLGDAVMDGIGPEAWPMSRDYDRGWLYNRQWRYEEAVAAFERGAERRSSAGLMYDAGRCYYGMGYALIKLNRNDAARTVLRRALEMFGDDNHEHMNQDALGAGSRSAQMTGLVLQILGIADMHEKNWEAALENLELSREHLLAVSNPGPMFDTLEDLIEVCTELNRPDKLTQYWVELTAMRTRYKLPGG